LAVALGPERVTYDTLQNGITYTEKPLWFRVWTNAVNEGQNTRQTGSRWDSEAGSAQDWGSRVTLGGHDYENEIENNEFLTSRQTVPVSVRIARNNDPIDNSNPTGFHVQIVKRGYTNPTITETSWVPASRAFIQSILAPTFGVNMSDRDQFDDYLINEGAEKIRETVSRDSALVERYPGGEEIMIGDPWTTSESNVTSRRVYDEPDTLNIPIVQKKHPVPYIPERAVAGSSTVHTNLGGTAGTAQTVPTYEMPTNTDKGTATGGPGVQRSLVDPALGIKGALGVTNTTNAYMQYPDSIASRPVYLERQDGQLNKRVFVPQTQGGVLQPGPTSGTANNYVTGVNPIASPVNATGPVANTSRVTDPFYNFAQSAQIREKGRAHHDSLDMSQSGYYNINVPKPSYVENQLTNIKDQSRNIGDALNSLTSLPTGVTAANRTSLTKFFYGLNPAGTTTSRPTDSELKSRNAGSFSVIKNNTTINTMKENDRDAAINNLNARLYNGLPTYARTLLQAAGYDPQQLFQ